VTDAFGVLHALPGSEPMRIVWPSPTRQWLPPAKSACAEHPKSGLPDSLILAAQAG
jgi:hypothetical protein